MKRSVREVLAGLGACGVLLVFLAGVPACLVRLVGNPLPSGLPAWSSVVANVEAGAVPPGVLVQVVAIVVWIWWSQVALSFGAEVVAAGRRRTAGSLPLRGLGMQPVVVRLVAVVVTAVSALGALAQPILASTPSFAEVAVPLERAESSNGDDPAFSPAPPALAPPDPEMSPLGIEQAPGALAAARPSAPAVPTLAPPREKVQEETAAAAMVEARVATSDTPAPILQPPPAIRAAPAASTADVVGVRGPSRAPQPAAAPSGESGWVVVKPGDSLWLLAERHLGDALRWEDIFELNAGPLPGGGTLRDPNLVQPGWRLRLPSPGAAALAGAHGAEPVALGPPLPSPSSPLR